MWDEHRIVPKTIVPTLLKSNSALDGAQRVQEVLAHARSANHHGTNKPCRAILSGHIRNPAQNEIGSIFVAQTITAVSSGVNPRCSVQRVYHQSGIVGQRDCTEVMRVEVCFYPRVVQKRSPILARCGHGRQFIQSYELRKQMLKQPPKLAHLPGVLRRYQQALGIRWTHIRDFANVDLRKFARKVLESD